MADIVAVVTGANKGIGLAIVKELCRRSVNVVYLTARNNQRGNEAIESLRNIGFHPKFHQLDITDKNSCKIFADFMKEAHGGIDIIINNAAITTSDFYKTTFEDAKSVIDVNYYGLINVQEFIFPILNSNARVINVSSSCGIISNLTDCYWIEQLTKDDMKLDDINDFIKWYLESVQNESIQEEDHFIETTAVAYRVSKIAITALTVLQQKEVGRGISVNCIHPGYVKTDLTKRTGYMTADDAAIAPVFLALDIDQSVKGKFFWFDKTEKDWRDPKLNLYCAFAEVEKCFREQLNMD
ncbi:carbonyl reductase [NADPH] 3-like [Leptidea sinapis]|uniref:carbonyl reductase [NADPH] 3-like n=1 Tax=Leptidea sinapis TaxID=189913 RepID=UPI0021C2B256|nr:carbonyl reductase [NADPH] 3-like [Leptidea sinapis]